MKKLLNILSLLLIISLTYSQEYESIGSVSKSVGKGSDASRINRAIHQVNILTIDSLTAIRASIILNTSYIVRNKAMIDSSKVIFNYETSTTTVETIITDSINTRAIIYTDTYWDDLRVPLSNTIINPAKSEPDFEDRGDGMFAWGFDADNDSTNVLNFTTQTPHEKKDSSEIEAHIHWQPDGTNTGSVVWKLIYSVSNINSTWTTTDTLRVIDPADGIALKHQVIDLGEIAGSDSLRTSACIVGTIARIDDATEDTYTGTAFGIELDFHYQIDRPGSEEEYTKY